MDLVVDANVFFSALIKEGASSDLLFVEELHLFTLEFILDEFAKHGREILDKTHRTKHEFIRLLDVFGRRVTTIPHEEIRPYLKEARGFSPDPDDIHYFALALRLRCGLWSNDKRLKGQDRVKVYSTKDLAGLLSRSGRQ